MLARGNTSLKWSATENMFVDCGTKEMDGSHMRRTLAAGEWSYSYDAKFVKQTTKPVKAEHRGSEVLSGVAVSPSDPIMGFLQGLAPLR